jgi:hypothetical protein
LGIVAIAALAMHTLAGSAAGGEPRGGNAPQATIAILPPGTTPAELARIPGVAIGLMSAGIGTVRAGQTYLDIGQGARIPPSLYDEPLPPVAAIAEQSGGPARIPERTWAEIRARAAQAPAELVPGLLGSMLRDGGVRVRTRVAGAAIAIAVDERGRVPARAGCTGGGCPRVELVAVDRRQLARLVRDLGGDGLLIAFERPPPTRSWALSIAAAGPGLAGILTSDSTRMPGYVLSTDIGPTVLERLGLAAPAPISGEPIRGGAELDPSDVGRLADRLAAIGPRRAPAVGANVLIWVALCGLAGLTFGRRGLRCALALLAVALAYLPALLLACAALEPSLLAERLIAGVGSPALAALTWRLFPSLGALAIASAVSVLSCAIDLIAGTQLIELSLAGPNPAGGVRLYGIGNELEATIAALVPLATGAGLATWAPNASRRTAALAFGLAAGLAVAAFAPGRLGADVGAAIGLPVGAAVAVATCLGAGRHRLALLLAAPVATLAALAAADLVSGGNAHLTRSVLRAGGFDQLADVFGRRLELSVQSFAHYARTGLLWPAAAAVVIGVIQWRRIEAAFGDRRLAWAGWLGAVAATLAGTLVNDSGALLLIIGGAIAAAAVGLAWATSSNPSLRNHGGSFL